MKGYDVTSSEIQKNAHKMAMRYICMTYQEYSNLTCVLIVTGNVSIVVRALESTFAVLSAHSHMNGRASLIHREWACLVY